MKLYKFRPLGDELSLCRAKQILETGEFWCSRFWELNDPMEGVFSVDKRDQDVIREVFSGKKKFVICSFSGKKAFANPIIWGYYANGFKGLAIEIEVENNKVKKIHYGNDVTDLSAIGGSPPSDEHIEKILTTKLCSWIHEDEYRFLDGSEIPGRRRQIGRITGVYFGNPYGTIDNRHDISNESEDLRKFSAFRTELEELAKLKNISYFRVNVVDGEVVQQS